MIASIWIVGTQALHIWALDAVDVVNALSLNMSWWFAGSAHLDRDMFSLMWGPTVAAVSVVLDHADDMSTVRQALDGLLQAAKLGAYHHVDEASLLVLFSYA